MTPETFPGLRIPPKCVCGRGSVPDPAVVAHVAPLDPLAGD